jgi:hypothetical protein
MRCSREHPEVLLGKFRVGDGKKLCIQRRLPGEIPEAENMRGKCLRCECRRSGSGWYARLCADRPAGSLNRNSGKQQERGEKEQQYGSSRAGQYLQPRLEFQPCVDFPSRMRRCNHPSSQAKPDGAQTSMRPAGCRTCNAWRRSEYRPGTAGKPSSTAVRRL